MLRRGLMLGGLSLAIMNAAAIAQKPVAAGTLMYIGTQEQAILGARLDVDTGHIFLLGQVAHLPRPTWLAVDPHRPILYSVSEIGNYDQEMGSVYDFSIDPETGALKQISKTSSGGHGATYVSYDPRVNTVFVSNFGGGQVSAIPVRPGGILAPPSSTQTDYGHGPNAKQLNPHAHGATLDPGGHFVLTPDMGADRVFVYKFDRASQTLSPSSPPFVDFGPNTGPRHLVFSPNGRFLFVLTELSAEVRTFRWDAAKGHAQMIQALPIDPPDFTGTRSGAEIKVSRDGRFVYISNRARNLLEVYAVEKQSGKLTHLQDIASGGNVPRSFGLDPSGRWLIVGNQASKTLTVFSIDKATGRLTMAGPPVPVDLVPVAFAFYRP